MRVKMSKQLPPAPTAGAVGPCPTIIRIENQLEVYSNGLNKSFSVEWPFCFINIMGEKNYL